MTENKLSEKELNEIREEAEKLYPVCMMGTPDKAKLHGITHYDFNEDQRQAYIAALTRERERVKGLIEMLKECEDYFDNKADADHDESGYIPNPEMKLLTSIRQSLSNYQKAKKQ